MLEVNFEKLGSAADKIRNNEFVIEDLTTKQDIDLQGDWEMCFRPGQTVDMSMLFDRNMGLPSSCPRCRHSCDGREDNDIDWYVIQVLFELVLTSECVPAQNAL